MSRQPIASQYVVPGRVNLIGEHTDYNGGLAMPFATDLALRVACAPVDRGGVTVRSREFGTWHASDPTTELWTRQADSVIRAVGGDHVDVVVESEIPAGAGLSSSAAFVAGIALALGHRDEPLAFATLVRDCEVAAGNNVGLLDPLAVLAARADHALLIDFANLSWEHVPIPPGLGFTVVHSGVARALVDTAYLRRRTECAALRALLPAWPPRETDLPLIDDEVLVRRARHIATENDRVRSAVAALRAHDGPAVGALVDESHASLRDDFEVSLPPVDQLVTDLRAQPGVLGARLMGGGFGGCVLVVHRSGVGVDAASHRSWRVRPSDGALARLRGA